ncbi:hypothetical protein PV325_001902 [Microctonus aethiopoides]|nr:hypothetical protein PV325_001902 [Microctonus aethiopoides]
MADVSMSSTLRYKKGSNEYQGYERYWEVTIQDSQGTIEIHLGQFIAHSRQSILPIHGPWIPKIDGPCYSTINGMVLSSSVGCCYPVITKCLTPSYGP